MCLQQRHGEFWRVWSGEGFKLISLEDAATEREAKIQSGTLVPWEIEKVVGVAYRRDEDGPWLMVLHTSWNISLIDERNKSAQK